MACAAAAGDLAEVRRLYEMGPQHHSTLAIDRAAFHGHLDVVVFLQKHRLGDSSRMARRAITGGHLDVLKYLIEAKAVKPSEDLAKAAALWGVTPIAKYLHENYHIQCCSAAVLRKALHRGRTETATYLITHCDAVKDPKVLELADIGGVDLLKIVLAARPHIDVHDALKQTHNKENKAYLTGLVEEASGDENAEDL